MVISLMTLLTTMVEIHDRHKEGTLYQRKIPLSPRIYVIKDLK